MAPADQLQVFEERLSGVVKGLMFLNYTHMTTESYKTLHSKTVEHWCGQISAAVVDQMEVLLAGREPPTVEELLALPGIDGDWNPGDYLELILPSSSHNVHSEEQGTSMDCWLKGQHENQPEEMQDAEDAYTAACLGYQDSFEEINTSDDPDELEELQDEDDFESTDKLDDRYNLDTTDERVFAYVGSASAVAQGLAKRTAQHADPRYRAQQMLKGHAKLHYGLVDEPGKNRTQHFRKIAVTKFESKAAADINDTRFLCILMESVVMSWLRCYRKWSPTTQAQYLKLSPWSTSEYHGVNTMPSLKQALCYADKDAEALTPEEWKFRNMLLVRQCRAKETVAVREAYLARQRDYHQRVGKPVIQMKEDKKSEAEIQAFRTKAQEAYKPFIPDTAPGMVHRRHVFEDDDGTLFKDVPRERYSDGVKRKIRKVKKIARGKACQKCVDTKYRCDGKTPCERCTKMGYACEPQQKKRKAKGL